MEQWLPSDLPLYSGRHKLFYLGCNSTIQGVWLLDGERVLASNMIAETMWHNTHTTASGGHRGGGAR